MKKFHRLPLAILIFLGLSLALTSAFAAPQEAKEKDREVVAMDKSGRGKPDTWVYKKNGSVVMREWDRNFDGKPDLRMTESRGHVLEKQYDDNFDGQFEKTVKTPRRI